MKHSAVDMFVAPSSTVVSQSRSAYLRYYRFYSAISIHSNLFLSLPLSYTRLYMLGTEDLKCWFQSCVAPTLRSRVQNLAGGWMFQYWFWVSMWRSDLLSKLCNSYELGSVKHLQQNWHTVELECRSKDKNTKFLITKATFQKIWKFHVLVASSYWNYVVLSSHGTFSGLKRNRIYRTCGSYKVDREIDCILGRGDTWFGN